MNLRSNIIDQISPIKDEMTEGEIFISEYLKERRIKFKTQEKYRAWLVTRRLLELLIFTCPIIIYT
jgi:hypothetical protein